MFIVSLAFLIKASDMFVSSAEKIGLALGVSPFIIGVTIVAFGTSLPELATSIASVYAGSSQIVIGNVVGSNITNILLIIGVVAIVGGGINLDYNIMEIDMPLLLSSAFLMWFTLMDGHLDYFEVGLYIVALGVFLLYSIKKKRILVADDDELKVSYFLYLLLAGIIIYFSADYVIYGLKGIAEFMKIDESVISLGALALGTSLPELVVSLAAIARKNHSIAVGNVVGSNIFNTYGVLGVSSLFGTLAIPKVILQVSIPMMVGITVLFGFVMALRKVSKWEGYMLLILYLFFLYSLTKIAPAIN